MLGTMEQGWTVQCFMQEHALGMCVFPVVVTPVIFSHWHMHACMPKYAYVYPCMRIIV